MDWLKVLSEMMPTDIKPVMVTAVYENGIKKEIHEEIYRLSGNWNYVSRKSIPETWIPQEEFNINLYNGNVFSRVLAPRKVSVYGMSEDGKCVFELKSELYIEVVPCNVILSFFDMLKYDRNRDLFDSISRIEFTSIEAEEIFIKEGFI